MQAIREVRDITTPTITIAIPDSFRRQRVEIIVLPISESSLQDLERPWPIGFLERFSGCLPDFPDIESEGPYESREALL